MPGTKPRKTDDEILELLRLPVNDSGRDKLAELMSGFSAEFSDDEKLFCLLYTYPTSKLCSKAYKCIEALGYWRSYADYVKAKPYINAYITHKRTESNISRIDAILENDVSHLEDVLSIDRTEFRKDDEFTVQGQDGNDDKTIERIIDKPIYELTKRQRGVISDFEYDKFGNAHYVIEKRSEARNALLNYRKMLASGLPENKPANEGQNLTLEVIRDKKNESIKIIARNEGDAQRAGQFIDAMSDSEEEA